MSHKLLKVACTAAFCCTILLGVGCAAAEATRLRTELVQLWSTQAELATQQLRLEERIRVAREQREVYARDLTRVQEELELLRKQHTLLQFRSELCDDWLRRAATTAGVILPSRDSGPEDDPLLVAAERALGDAQYKTLVGMLPTKVQLLRTQLTNAREALRVLPSSSIRTAKELEAPQPREIAAVQPVAVPEYAPEILREMIARAKLRQVELETTCRLLAVLAKEVEDGRERTLSDLRHARAECESLRRELAQLVEYREACLAKISAVETALNAWAPPALSETELRARAGTYDVLRSRLIELHDLINAARTALNPPPKPVE